MRPSDLLLGSLVLVFIAVPSLADALSVPPNVSAVASIALGPLVGLALFRRMRECARTYVGQGSTEAKRPAASRK